MFGSIKIFRSYQPSIMFDCEDYVEYKNEKLVSCSIVLFYQFKVKRALTEQIFIIPDGCIDLIFACDRNNPHAIVGGTVVYTKKFNFIPGEKINLTSGIEYFGVRLLPGTSSIFFNCPGKEFVDKLIKLNDLLKDGRLLVEMIKTENGFDNRMKTFFNYYIRNIELRNVPVLVGYLLRRINEESGLITITDLSEESGYSSRYLRKVFKEYTGMGPKLFCRVRRFQNALDYVFGKSDEKIAQKAWDFGYYDQAHFLHEFKAFCLLTPNQFLEKIQDNCK